MARTSSSASSRRTAGPRPRSSSTGSRSCPRRRVEYRGVVVEEMDTDAILARHPTVALVDELAHTNAPGSARAKRWEDVDVLLDAGIDVVSTCNIQHLDSVADAVATITGAPVNERIPDEVLAAADEVELVDMSPYALRQRMRHGNVYPPERDRDRARPVLHRVEPDGAARAGAALRRRPGRRPARGHRHARPSRTCQRAGPRPRRSRRRRRRGRCAGRPRPRPSCARRSWRSSSRRRPMRALPLEQGRRIREYLDDATDLGAEIILVEASDVVEGIVRIARARRVTRLVMPHPDRRRRSSGSAGRPWPSGSSSACRRSRSRSWPTRARRPTPIAVGRRRLISRVRADLVLPAYQSTAWRDPTPTHTLCHAAGRTLPLNTTGDRTVETTCRARL